MVQASSKLPREPLAMTEILQAAAAFLGAILNLILAYEAYTAKEKAWKVAVPALSAIAFLATAVVKAGPLG